MLSWERYTDDCERQSNTENQVYNSSIHTPVSIQIMLNNVGRQPAEESLLTTFFPKGQNTIGGIKGNELLSINTSVC